MVQQLHMRRQDLEDLGEVTLPFGYQIRTYTKGDEEAWAEIINNSLGSGWDAKRCRRELTGRPQFRPAGLFFVTYNDKPVGTACAWTHPNSSHSATREWPGEKKTGYIHMVGVLPEHRGRRLGYVLCLCVLRFLRENGFQHAELRTDDFRFPAVKTYLNLGFEPDYVDESHRERWDAIFARLASGNNDPLPDVDDMRTPDRRIKRLLPSLLMIPVVAIYLLLLSSNWKPTWDSATYIMLGKSLITGHGFKYMDIPHTKYPFMFPLMLSPIIGLFGLNFLLMRLFIVLMGIGSIGLTFWLFRRNSGMVIGLGVMVMTAASYTLMSECTRILSDIPYMFLSLLSLIFVSRYAHDERWLSKSGYISAVLILASFFTRYISLALLAGAVIYLLLESRSSLSLRLKKIALISIVFLIPASLWIVRGVVIRRINPPPSDLREFLSYEKEFAIVSASDPHSRTLRPGDLVSRVRRNKQYYQDLAADIVSGKNTNSRTRARVVSIILLCGFIYCLIKWRGVFEYYVFFYVLVYITWTSLQGTRFLVPIIPFIFYYLIRALWLIPDGLSTLIIRLVAGRHIWKDGYRIWAERIILASLILISVYWNWSSDVDIISEEHRKPYYTGSVANFLEAIGWIKENTPLDTVIVSDRAPWVYMLSDRKTFTFPWINNAEEVMASIRKNNADYVILSPVGGYALKFLSPVLKKRPSSFLSTYEKGDCTIYKVMNVKNLRSSIADF